MAASAVVVFSPADTESIEAENREAAAMPEFRAETAMNGEFASGFDSYVNDNIGFRGKLMEISDNIQSWFGFTPKLVGRIISTTSDIGTGETLDTNLMLIDGKIMEMFSNKPEVEKQYAQALNNIKTSLPEGIHMYSMLVPTQLEFEDPLYANAQDSQKDCIESIDSMLDEGITPVDVYSELQNSDDDYLYFRTDHHWTMDGAYCGYRAFMEKTGAEIIEKDKFERIDRDEFFGTLYMKARAQLDDPKKDELFYYDTEKNNDLSIKMRVVYEDGSELEYGENSKLFDEEKDDYLFFLGGDQPLIEITNNSRKSGKTLILIKDSYANALVPWLVNNYKKIILIDPRSYIGNLNDEIERYKADEVAVVNYVFTTTFTDYCELLNNLADN